MNGEERRPVHRNDHSPERRTGDQRDQLGLAFDAIIDCANIEDLIEEGVLVKPIYRPISCTIWNWIPLISVQVIFQSTKLSSASRSSMIDYAIWSYNEERLKTKGRPISAWFCADVSVAETPLRSIRENGIEVTIVTAKTPQSRRMKLLARHESSEIEAMVSVGVLSRAGITAFIFSCTSDQHFQRYYGGNRLAVDCGRRR